MPASNASVGSPRVAVVGGGPAGLMVADLLSQAGISVHLFDAMPSVGRKFLLAGKGGLNLTHSEDAAAFRARYRARAKVVAPWLDTFGAAEVRSWAQALGVETFVGTSGRVFPRDLKAAPLLRAWLHRLRLAGVHFHMRHRWMGWAETAAGEGMPLGLRFATPAGEVTVQPERATVLALGGASWPQLGSDGAWVPWLNERGVDVAPLAPANCGFDVARRDADGAWQAGWTAHLRTRFSGAPLKNIGLQVREPTTQTVLFEQNGEAVVTQHGLEGSVVYAASAVVRELLTRHERVSVHMNLLPQRAADWVAREVQHARGPRSLATHLKSRLGIDGVKAALLHEVLPRDVVADPVQLAAALHALPVTVVRPRPIAEAISTAGGVRFEALTPEGMLQAVPGVFVAGEMIDWEAPTGGYLLTACLASGVQAAEGVRRFIGRSVPADEVR